MPLGGGEALGGIGAVGALGACGALGAGGAPGARGVPVPGTFRAHRLKLVKQSGFMA